jgi:hypothetical protein
MAFRLSTRVPQRSVLYSFLCMIETESSTYLVIGHVDLLNHFYLWANGRLEETCGGVVEALEIIWHALESQHRKE